MSHTSLQKSADPIGGRNKRSERYIARRHPSTARTLPRYFRGCPRRNRTHRSGDLNGLVPTTIETEWLREWLVPDVTCRRTSKRTVGG